MKIISLSDTEVLSEKAKTSDRYILRGLPEVGIGTLLAGQDMGKSRLMYSIAYSLATNIDLVGLLPDDEKDRKPRKVAIWSAEEGVNWTSKKVLTHLSHFSTGVTEQLKERVSIIDDTSSEGDQEYLFSGSGEVNHRFISHLINYLKDFDILFIDTLREVMGLGDEVNDDTAMKVLLSRIAKESQCAIFYLHHLRKADTNASSSKLSTVSGSGLSKTNAKARVHYALTRNERTKAIELCFVKANNIATDERVSVELDWLEMAEHSIHLNKRNLSELKDELLTEHVVEVTEYNEVSNLDEIKGESFTQPRMEVTDYSDTSNLEANAHTKEEDLVKSPDESTVLIESTNKDDIGTKVDHVTSVPKQDSSKNHRTVEVPDQVVHKIIGAEKTPSNVSSNVRSLRNKAKHLKAKNDGDQD